MVLAVIVMRPVWPQHPAPCVGVVVCCRNTTLACVEWPLSDDDDGSAGLLPLEWRLTGTESLPPEIKVFPASGHLEARTDTRVSVEFVALEKREVAGEVALELLDVGRALPPAPAVPLTIKGEAYKMEVDVRFPQVRSSMVWRAGFCCDVWLTHAWQRDSGLVSWSVD
jgi:hypothetical protein